MATKVNTIEWHIKARDEAKAVFDKHEKSLKKLGHRFEKTAKGAKGLQDKMRNMASSVAVLEGPLGGIAGRLNAVGAAFGRVNPLIIGFGVALSGITIGSISSVKAAAKLEQQLFKLGAVHKATGGAVGFTVAQLQDMAKALGEATLASAEGARGAQAALMSFTNVTGDQFEKALNLAQDFTATFGGELKANAIKIGRALDAPREGLQGLTRSVTAFTPKYRMMIADMFESGDVIGAQGEIIKTLTNRIGGVGIGEAGGLIGRIDTLGERWTSLLQTMGRTSAVSGVVGFMSTRLEGLAQIIDYISGPVKTYKERMHDLNLEWEKEHNFLTKRRRNSLTEATRVRSAHRLAAISLKFQKLIAEQKVKEVSESSGALAQQEQVSTASYNSLIRHLSNADEAIGLSYAKRAMTISALDEKRADEQGGRQNLELRNTEIFFAKLDALATKAKPKKIEADNSLERRLFTEEQLIGESYAKRALIIEAADLSEVERTRQRLENSNQFFTDLDGKAEESRINMERISKSIGDTFGSAFADMALQQKTWAEASRQIVSSIFGQLISGLVSYGIQKAILFAVGETQKATSLATSIAAALAMTKVWGPAAAAVSLATGGANAVGALAGIGAVSGATAGLSIFSGQFHDGTDYVPKTGTYLLEKGERVVKKEDNKKLSSAIDSGMGGVTYNVNINAVDQSSVAELMTSQRGLFISMMQNARLEYGR